MAGEEFSAGTQQMLARAETICSRRGTRLTSLRRHVLGLVMDSDKPAGAYDLLDRLRLHHRGAAPPTVYRALDFLLEQGLIHKVERLSAFVGCIHGTDLHAVQFLICSRCGGVTELSDSDIGQALMRAAATHGFALSSATVEADGICAKCRADA